MLPTDVLPFEWGRQVNAEAAFHLQVAGLTIDPLRRRVAGPGGEAAMEPMVMRLLEELANVSGEVLSRRQLVDSLWGKASVGDDSLNRLVYNLRKALESTSHGIVTIETIPRVGYRLSVERRERSQQLPISRRAAVIGGASLALTIGAVGAWRTVRERHLHESRQLISRGDVLLRDAVPMQAGEAEPPLLAALRLEPNNPTALGLLALAQETRANNGGSDKPGETLRSAEQSATRALQRDPKEPHASLAMIDIKAGSLDWVQMEDRLNALCDRAPDNVHVLGSVTSFLQAAGRTSESWSYNERAAALAPSSPTPRWRRALRLWTAGRIEEALQLSEKLLPLWPTHALVWNARFMILAFTGRTAAAAAMLSDSAGPAGNAHPVQSAQWLPTLVAFDDPSPANLRAARSANLAAAQLNPGQATYAALALGQMGHIDDALAVIDALLLSKGPLVARRPIMPRSFLANSPSWCRTQWLFMPPLAAVRRDPRFDVLSEEIGLTRYWKQRKISPDMRLPLT